MSTAEFSNTAMGEATEQIMTIIGSAARLRDGYATTPVWGNIRNDDPRIQRHPLGDKARSITVARPTPAPLSRVAVPVGDLVHVPAPSKSGTKPKPKPLSKKTKDA
jgi:hypothetical protein